MTVSDLLEDRVALDGVLLKCNQNFALERSDSDCQTARIAVERLAQAESPADDAKRSAEFERRRERLRMRQDEARRDEEAKAKIDAYDLPVVPDPAPAVEPPASAIRPKP